MVGLSTYHRFCCALAWTEHGDLLSCTGPLEETVRKHWSNILASVTASPLQQSLVFPSTGKVQGEPSLTSKSLVRVDTIQQGELALYKRRNPKAIFGLILRHQYGGETDFDDVFASLLLNNLELFTSAPQNQASNIGSRLEDTTNAIIDLFDARLRYISAADKWSSHGRKHFYGCVHEFVRRRTRLEFCLPAFPCKSSNVDKVHSVMPDRGEQLALEHLHSFIEAIETIYEPGAKLWVVSDGHVFSDCIGVDDDMVDRYIARLISMNTVIAQSRGGIDRVGFKSLVDLFDLKHSVADVKHSLQLPTLESYIFTQRTEAAEVSRQILVSGCKTVEGVLRSRIESGNHSALKLYRGFSRFMVEDLTLNRYTKHLSRRKLKNLATKISFEMIQRNEAYSNLVGLLFPYHVRLSIHAHENAGPKFGIRLFGPDVRALKSLSFDGGEMYSYDLLHVPTPWHNCLVQVSGHSTLAMVKSKTVKEALLSGKFSGSWVEESHQGVAGHFHLQPVHSQLEGITEDFVASDSLGYPFLPTAVVDANMAYLRALTGVGVF